MRIGVLSNLRAGRVTAAAERVRAVLASHRDILHFETRASDKVEDALGVFEQEGVELLVLNGGDGTLQRALTRIAGAKPRTWLPLVAPLRGGRTNTSALSLGVQRDPGRGLEALIEAVRTGTLEERIDERPVLRIDLGAQGVHYGTFFGAGILHNAIRLTHERFPDGRAQGWLGASVTTGTLIGRALLGRYGGVLSPEKFEVELDGSPVGPDHFLILMATTLDRLFMRMNPFWGTEDGPVRFATIAERLGGWRNVRVLRGLPPGKPTPGYVSHNVDVVTVRMDGGFTIDGELFAPHPGRRVRLSAEDRVRFVRA
ncbi:MAG: diacylglycerol kinase family protein [Myxococcota bacterium]|nr:diacylglycerol kinase family protein [Myxococcota bacterium]